MKTLIVDDNEMARLALRNLVPEVPSLNLVGECTSASEAFIFLQDNPVDLVFLDVEMPGMTGIDLIKALKNAPLFILVTSKKEYALDGFDLQVADYILKPVTMPRFLAAVQFAKELFDMRSATYPIESTKENQPSFMFVRVNNQLVRIDFGDILYVQALGDYVLIFVPGKKYPVHLTMKAIEERLPADKFTRVHRSYIVAFDKVSSLEENSILINKEVIPLSESHRAAFLKKMNTL
jgi:DNA-binding LytR/AlgR family response regulator